MMERIDDRPAGRSRFAGGEPCSVPVAAYRDRAIDMAHRLEWGAIRDSKRTAIYVVRVHGELLEPPEIDEIANRMRDRLQSRGELAADVVVVQGASRETFRLFGTPYSVARVRTALFNAAVSWSELGLD
jgi:hypothetical protein